MRVLLIFLLVVVATIANQLREVEKASKGSNEAVEFLKGFLEGIGETGDVNKLLQCLKDLEGVINKIKEALEHIKQMRMEEIVKGLTMLFQAIREFADMLRPCIEGFEVLKKLIKSILSADIIKIAMRIMTHPHQFIHDIMEAISCFDGRDFKCAGKNVGDLLRIMFLARSTAQDSTGNDAVEFLKGFLEGIGQKGDINNLLKCLRDMEIVFNKLVEALNHIRSMRLEEIVKGLTQLMEAIKEFLEMLKPCTEGYEVIKRLIQSIKNAEIIKIAMRILSHPTQFIYDINEAINCFGRRDYFCAGKSIGDLLRIIFLARLESQ